VTTDDATRSFRRRRNARLEGRQQEMFPEELKYTAEHEWVRADSEAGTARVGITHFAADALGDIVYVSLPEPGTEVTAGQPCGEVESTKSVSDVYAPVSGTVVERNDALEGTPEMVNSDPYGDGWMFEVRPSQADAVDGLLDAATYAAGLDPS
jgi:glycine cleavage system H protein